VRVRVIYVDILLALNLIVNYLLIYATAKLSGSAFSGRRGLLGAVLGAMYSLVMLIQVPALLLAVSKLAVSCLMVAAAFGRRRAADFLRLMVFFYGAGFMFAGLMLLVQTALSGSGIYYQNGVVYYEMPAVWIVVSASAAFLLSEGLRRLIRHGESSGLYRAQVWFGGRSVVIAAMTDTGNSLREPFSGEPVAVCGAALLKELLPPEYLAAAGEPDERLPKGMRLVPCRTASGAALLPAFRPERLCISRGGKTMEAEAAYIALSTSTENRMLIGSNMCFSEIIEKRMRGKKDASWVRDSQ